MSQSWIWSVTPENWEILKRENIWASKIPIEKISGRIHPGDKVVFYVIGSKGFQGIFEFVDNWYDAASPVWSDEKDQVIYQSQIKIKPLKLGNIRVYDVAPKLSFFQDPYDKRLINLVLKGGSGYPSNSGKAIPEEDFSIITNLMGDTGVEFDDHFIAKKRDKIISDLEDMRKENYIDYVVQYLDVDKPIKYREWFRTKDFDDESECKKEAIKITFGTNGLEAWQKLQQKKHPSRSTSF